MLFATGGSDAVGGMMTKPAEVPHPAWLYYFNVAGIDAAVERVKANDGAVLNGPMEVPAVPSSSNATIPRARCCARRPARLVRRIRCSTRS